MTTSEFDRNLLKAEPFRAAFLGSSGTGKTTYLFSLFDTDIKNHFNYVYCVSTELNFIKQYSSHIWPDKFIAHDRLSLGSGKDMGVSSVLQSILEEIMNFAADLVKKRYIERSEKNTKILIIFDDCDSILTKNEGIKTFLTRCRHVNISIIVLIQDLTQIPPMWRNQLSHLFFFGQVSEKSRKIITGQAGFNSVCDSQLRMIATIDPGHFSLKGSPLVLVKDNSKAVFKDRANHDTVKGKYKLDFLFYSRSQQKKKFLEWYKTNRRTKTLTLDDLKRALKTNFLA
ncbi:packaging ATPase A32 [Salmon gill poxvirus]|uniref:DNA packaging protein OPG160 n=1 Tax=Salmon gill poxvirus TaxID=1680908 RepID=A0A0H4Y1A8_9POXV|nr:packaging ATPase A32 [Salmon gill poxvirus]AKR04192.1 packaging ATPase A32 [Salmon gill poxvirus]WMX26474.1 packaging ATPase A32 [Salmon gill poxvirus]